MSGGRGRFARPRLLAPLLAAAVLAACSHTTGHGAGDQAGPVSSSGGAASSVVATTAAPTTVVASTAAPTTTARARRRVTMVFTGDTLLHQPVYARAGVDGRASGRAFDFGPMFALVAPELSAADLAICHQETVLSADDGDLSGYPMFSSPHEIVDALRDAGYDGCSTASNHSMDRGRKGVDDTVAVFAAAGLGQSGLARSASEAATPEWHTVQGVRVAHLAYSYGLNGLPLPPGEPWAVKLIDPGRDAGQGGPYPPDAILADAHAARTAGADLVVVSLQWGVEYQARPTPAQVELARALTASPDVDLVVGHHVHVIQPVDRVGDKVVVYGLGNFLSNQSAAAGLAPSTQDGVIVGVTFAEGPEGGFTAQRVTFTPTWVDIGAGYVITPVAAALRDPDLAPGRRAALEASWSRTVAAIDALGASSWGVTPTAVP